MSPAAGSWRPPLSSEIFAGARGNFAFARHAVAYNIASWVNDRALVGSEQEVHRQQKRMPEQATKKRPYPFWLGGAAASWAAVCTRQFALSYGFRRANCD